MTLPKLLRILTLPLLVAVVAVAALYAREVYTLARISDHTGLVMAAHLRDSVPGLAIRKEPTQVIVDATVIAAAGTGSLGDCSYLLLRKCIAVQVDARVNDQPRLLSSIVEVLSDVCKSVSKKVGRESQLLSSYFECDEERRPPVRVQVNIVEGLGRPAYKIPQPSGGVTYGRPARSLLSQIVLVSGG